MSDPMILVPKSNSSERDPRLVEHRDKFGIGPMGLEAPESAVRPNSAVAYDAITGCYVGLQEPAEPGNMPPFIPQPIPYPFPTDEMAMTHHAGFHPQPHHGFHRRQHFVRRPYVQQQPYWGDDGGGDWGEQEAAPVYVPVPVPQLPLAYGDDAGDGDFMTGRGGGGGGGGGHGGGGGGHGGFGGGHGGFGGGHGFGGHHGFGGGGFGGGGWWGGWPYWGGGWGPWGYDYSPWGYWDDWFDPAYGYAPFYPYASPWFY